MLTKFFTKIGMKTLSLGNNLSLRLSAIRREKMSGDNKDSPLKIKATLKKGAGS